jgi:photosystem II stability/assembly factor-like uncharacterized protein
MDGEITFHDWHPVNIEEYGEAAPDPKNPNLVYGGKVTVYDRLTAQKANIAPARGPTDPPDRTVRTQPIIWSPKDPNILFFATAGVWKTVNGGHSWTAISGDLTRQTWAIPANAGKYASTVTPAAQGSITSLAPSPLDVNVLWAGTGDGLIQVTTNGGMKWNDVTPPQIKPWTRIFNMEAGHFDTKTAYVAANTLRLDDLNPHFWRTHDGGKTWTEIDRGIAAGSASNSIREDPRKKGLLYAATDTQVWVSVDDGDNWSSLRLDMPAISVRDIQVKDDDSCLCSDLVAGTHGRGFWILDDVTPLRQAAEAASATGDFIFKPEPGIRVRFGTNDPTPWPPELPAGENPPAGAIVDYYVPSAVGQMKLEFLNAQGKVVRTYRSDDPVRKPDPASDPAAYNKLCQDMPTAPDCGLPLYWPAPPQVLKTLPGMHRFTWDMRYDVVPGTAGGGRGGGGATGAVPHRTYSQPNAPWVAPGSYTVRLTSDGHSVTQPILVKMDPRVKVTPEVQQIFTLTTRIESDAQSALSAQAQARTLLDKLKAQPQSSDRDALIKKLEEIAPAEAPATGAPTLTSISGQLIASVMSMQAAEMPPTAAELAACAKQEEAYIALMAKWSALKAAASK